MNLLVFAISFSAGQLFWIAIVRRNPEVLLLSVGMWIMYIASLFL